jgi:hypothetical protein
MLSNVVSDSFEGRPRVALATADADIGAEATSENA